jgi:hypothetical protein
MAGDNDGNGISANSLSHRLGGHFFSQLFRNGTVSGGFAIGNAQQDFPDLPLKIRSDRGEGKIDFPVLSGKVIIQPVPDSIKKGQRILPGKAGNIIIMGFHPQTGEGFAVGGEDE